MAGTGRWRQRCTSAAAAAATAVVAVAVAAAAAHNPQPQAQQPQPPLPPGQKHVALLFDAPSHVLPPPSQLCSAFLELLVAGGQQKGQQ